MITFEEVVESTIRQIVRASDAEMKLKAALEEIGVLKLRIQELSVKKEEKKCL